MDRISKEEIKTKAHECAVKILNEYYSEMINARVIVLSCKEDYEVLPEYGIIMHAFSDGAVCGLDSIRLAN